ncbi:MAG: DNA cytosine methyltransferase [Xenococcus sp. (in: cyanobacteria)]
MTKSSIYKNRIEKKTHHTDISNKLISCVDLFCGVGGLTNGLIKGGIQVIAGIDLDADCRFPYETNNDAVFIERDVNKLQGSEIKSLFGDSQFTLLAGCAPCQPFSTYSQTSRRTRTDSKWELVSDFGRLIRETKPDFVTMENVPQLLDHNIFQIFLSELEEYSVWYKVVNCAQYGIPQTRKRLVLLASRLGIVELISSQLNEEDYKTVRESVFNLPKLKAGETNKQDPLHTASSLSELNLRRIKASKPGGTWRDWDQSLLAKCHRKTSGQTYPSVYGRMEWDKPAPTITTQCFGYGNGRFGHPEQDRAISLREAAILQTFPPDYQFLPPGEKVIFSKLGRFIGNAVPVRLGEVIAESLLKNLKDNIKS